VKYVVFCWDTDHIKDILICRLKGEKVLVKYVVFCWDIDHINAKAAISNSAGIYLYLQICYTFLVDCLGAR
jgi:hypothetical protein